ncbi:RDD family protein [Mycobacterium sp. DL592]|uniref:RDD family protein n=1 Tax=Mycobacterium sp. DL592 TaxID=2675524 RepID=UPI001423725A|nr:RDD family protein [Mycobacterium sp. DL592]
MPGQPTGTEAACAQCGSTVRANAPYCAACGAVITNRQPHQSVSYSATAPTAAAAHTSITAPVPAAAPVVVDAGGGVRCCAMLLDLAVMVSPALPLTAAAAVLACAEVVYVVVPVAVVAVWLWMQIWQGFTGLTFGKAMLGLRLIRTRDQRPPGFITCMLRSGIFAATAGVAALPVVTGSTLQDGWHDRLSGLGVIDVTLGANPLGAPQQTTLRATTHRGLNKVASPVPLASPGRR